MLDGLERAMREAADARAFERAAVLRDALQMLRMIDRGLGRLRELRSEFSFIYELRCRKGEQSWVFLRAGHAIAAHIKPSGARSARSVLQRIDNVYTECESPQEDDLDMLRLVGSWFYQHEREIRRTRSVEEATAICESLLTGSRSPRHKSAATR
jgi:excinuclease UvrABC nuclease subunit